jgi:hypothetical protein
MGSAGVFPLDIPRLRDLWLTSVSLVCSSRLVTDRAGQNGEQADGEVYIPTPP